MAVNFRKYRYGNIGFPRRRSLWKIHWSFFLSFFSPRERFLYFPSLVPFYTNAGRATARKFSLLILFAVVFVFLLHHWRLFSFRPALPLLAVRFNSMAANNTPPPRPTPFLFSFFFALLPLSNPTSNCLLSITFPFYLFFISNFKLALLLSKSPLTFVNTFPDIIFSFRPSLSGFIIPSAVFPLFRFAAL